MLPNIKDKGLIINSVLHLSARESVELCNEGAIIVDIREEYETDGRQFGVENMILLPNSVFKEHYKELPHNEFLIIADGVGSRSKETVMFLQKNGFKHIANLVGGIVDWQRDGFKVITDPKEMLSGQCACMLKSKTGKKFNFK